MPAETPNMESGVDLSKDPPPPTAAQGAEPPPIASEKGPSIKNGKASSKQPPLPPLPKNFAAEAEKFRAEHAN